MPLSRFVSARFPSLARVLIPGFLMLSLSACGGGGGGNGLQGGVVIPPPPDPILNAPPRIGNGTGTTFVNGVITASQTTIDSGQRAQLRVNVVNGSGQGIDGTVAFASPCVTGARATISPVTIVGTGLYQVDYTNINCDGPDIVTATLAASGTNPAATATVTLTTIGPQALTVSFVSSSFDQLSLAGIGGNESAELIFRVAGPQGIPVVGKQVTFSLNTPAGGASILPSRATGVTDQNGNVSTVLLSGTVAGSVNVLATHAESGRRGLSTDIIISTGVPQASRFSLSYTPQNPPAANDTDGVTVSLNIIASDAFGNNPTDGTRVSFVAPESGNIQNSCLLTDGACTVTWRSTAPRPADMRATVIAFTDGAENFVDRNGNSVFDAGDGAISDLGEPYADENEDGAYQLGEYFFDTDRDGLRDVGNTLWDGPCLVKVNSAAICTGNNVATIYATAVIAMSNDFPRIYALGTFPAPGTTITIAQGQSVAYSGMYIADSNTAADRVGANPLPLGTAITFALEGGGTTLQGVPASTIQNTTRPTGPYGIAVRANPVAAGGTLPSGVRLLMNVQVPGEALRQFSWPIIVTM